MHLSCAQSPVNVVTTHESSTYATPSDHRLQCNPVHHHACNSRARHARQGLSNAKLLPASFVGCAYLAHCAILLTHSSSHSVGSLLLLDCAPKGPSILTRFHPHGPLNFGAQV